MRLRCRATAQDAILIHPEGVLEVVRAAYVLSGGVLNVASACCPHRCGRTAERCRSDAVVGVRDGAELPSGACSQGTVCTGLYSPYPASEVPCTCVGSSRLGKGQTRHGCRGGASAAVFEWV